MDKNYSAQYDDLYKFIKKNRIPKGLTQAIQLKLGGDREGYTLLIIILAVLLCIIGGIVCLFTAWKIGAIVALFVLMCLIVLLKIIVIDSRYYELSSLEKGDKIFAEQKQDYHYAVSGFYYYQAKKAKSELGEKRLLQLLEVPEFLEYFNENGLIYTSGMFSSNNVVDEYIKYVTDYYGNRLIKTGNYELFLTSNALMLNSQIKLYDKTDDISEIRENDLYYEVKKYHANWCRGDVKSRKLFEDNYLNEEVLRGYDREMKHISEFFDKHPGSHPDYGPYTRTFFHIIEKASEEKLFDVVK